MVSGNKFGLRLATLALVLLAVGCADNPGTWPQPKLEAKMKERLELTELTLTPKPEGGYEGTGKRADGETLTIILTQDPAAQSYSWDVHGDRGFIEDGTYELVK